MEFTNIEVNVSISSRISFLFSQANLTIQEAKLELANKDLDKAQAQLNEKEAELQEVQMMYDSAVKEKQVTMCFPLHLHFRITDSYDDKKTFLTMSLTIV